MQTKVKHLKGSMNKALDTVRRKRKYKNNVIIYMINIRKILHFKIGQLGLYWICHIRNAILPKFFFVLVKVSAGKPSIEFISTVTKNKDVGIFVYTDDG